MFLHLGNDKVILEKDIVAILNTEIKQVDINKEFFKSVDSKIKSCIITTEKKYFSTISCDTLKKRSESSFYGKNFILTTACDTLKK